MYLHCWLFDLDLFNNFDNKHTFIVIVIVIVNMAVWVIDNTTASPPIAMLKWQG